MGFRALPTQSRLQELFDYDPSVGVFIRRKSLSNVKAGDVAGTLKDEYVQINVDGTIYKAHRLAWMYVYGVEPKSGIDHINGIRADNRLCNLREATQSQNGENKIRHKNNKSGYRGVSWHKASKKWKASIFKAGKTFYLGIFPTAKEAFDEYCRAKKRIHTFEPNVREA